MATTGDPCPSPETLLLPSGPAGRGAASRGARRAPRGASVPVAARAIALAAVALAACRTPTVPAAPARAAQIVSPSQLVRGPAQSGALGDIRLDNGVIAAVITSSVGASGFAASGGNLVDLAPVAVGSDHLNEVFLYLNDEFPRQAQYRRVDIIDAGGGSRAARVRASGYDTRDPRIAIATDYVLAPDQPWITLETRITSSATLAITSYEIGDAVQWGRTEHMAPGHGFDLPGRRMRVDWISGLGADVSYAFVPDGPWQFDCINGAMWSDPIGATVDLVPGRTVTYRRHIVVGHGDTASLSAAVSRLRRDATGQLRGRVLSGTEGVAKARVLIKAPGNGRLVGVAMTDEVGRYSIVLPPGRYQLEAHAPGRPPSVEPTTEVQSHAATVVSFRMRPQSRLAWRIVDEAGDPVPVRIGVMGIDGTATPRFGPSFAASGAERFVFSLEGHGEIPVSPGRYRVVASRGMEFALVDHTVTIEEGQTRPVRDTLRRAFETPGLISADLHQHAAPSFDSGVSLEDRVLSNATEGVEILVASDHNTLTDYRPVIERMGLSGRLRSIVGVEATTHSVGHFNVLPLSRRPGAARGGMVDPEGWTPQEILRFTRGLAVSGITPFAQVNHPRARGNGYFTLMGLDRDGQAEDPRYSPDFDGMEVVALGYPGETRQARRDWFGFLKRGRHMTATGTSDTHTLTRRPPGWPRTFVCVDDDRPDQLDLAAFTRALRQGCVTISSGPVVTIQAPGARMGGLTTARRGRVPVDVVIKAAPWVATDRLTLYVDGRPAITRALSGRSPVRFDDTLTVSCPADCFVVAEVTAQASLEPVVATRAKMKPSPLGLTNAIYVDADGDGRYRSGDAGRPR